MDIPYVSNESPGIGSGVMSICAYGMGIGLGVCVLAGITVAHHARWGHEIVIGGLTLFFVSLAGLAFTGIFLAVAGFVNIFRS